MSHPPSASDRPPPGKRDPSGRWDRRALVKGDPSFDEKRCFLATPATYPHRPRTVVVRETHMSVVFLAGELVYKLKKPVCFPFLDFRKLAARERNCREEVRLNRRLAPEVYLGTKPLTVASDGALGLGADGRIVDWLVVMRRLPDHMMLDRRLAEGRVGPSDLDRLGAVLARFYAETDRADLDPSDYADRFARQQAENRNLLASGPWPAVPARTHAILDRFDIRLEATRPLLRQRVEERRVVEGHGDLRPEHVCLTDPIAIFDCLEFDRELRLVDTVDEIGYLGLECTLLGHPEVGAHLGALLATATGDAPPRELAAFYTAFRALLRARLALAHLLDPVPRDPSRWAPLAARYLALADAALD